MQRDIELLTGEHKGLLYAGGYRVIGGGGGGGGIKDYSMQGGGGRVYMKVTVFVILGLLIEIVEVSSM